MGLRQALDDALLRLGKRGKDIDGLRAPVAIISLSLCVLLFPHLPSGLLYLICGLALPQGQKARKILFGAASVWISKLGLSDTFRLTAGLSLFINQGRPRAG